MARSEYAAPTLLAQWKLAQKTGKLNFQAFQHNAPVKTGVLYLVAIQRPARTQDAACLQTISRMD